MKMVFGSVEAFFLGQKEPIYGLNWRDISDAVYYTGFISWFLKSYKLVIQHRYTKSSELVLKNIKNGDQLVQEINKKVKELNLY